MNNICYIISLIIFSSCSHVKFDCDLVEKGFGPVPQEEEIKFNMDSEK